MTIGTALVGDYFEGRRGSVILAFNRPSPSWVASFSWWRVDGSRISTGARLLLFMPWRCSSCRRPVFLREPARNSSRATQNGEQGLAVNWLPVAVLAMAVFLVNALFYTIPSQLPFFLREFGVLSGSVAGYAIGIFNLAGALMALSFGRLRARIGVTVILAAGLVLMATGFALLATAGGLSSMLSALAVVGAGLGAVMPSIMSTTIMLAPLRLRGRIAGIVTASMFLGHFISPLVSQP